MSIVLIKSRTISLIGELQGTAPAIFHADFAGMVRQSSERIINIVIDCPGGRAGCWEPIRDILMSSTTPTRGVVVGNALSAGFNILQYCAKRIALPAARFMFHAPRITPEMQASLGFGACEFPNEKTGQLEERDIVLKDNPEYLAFLSRLTNRSKPNFLTLRGWGEEERQYDAHEAFRLGFIDQIVYRITETGP